MNRLFETKWLIVIGIAVLLTLAFASRKASSNKTAASENGIVSQEKVVTFSEDIGGEQGRGRLEQAINEWLKQNNGKVEITGRTQSGDSTRAIVMIWYKTR